MHSLPAALAPFAAYRQFMLYELRPNPKKPGKFTKHPALALPVGDLPALAVASAHDPANWVDHATACCMALLSGPRYGVAFVFTEADPFWFVDIDGCIDEAGAWSPLSLEILGYFPGCAVELSQSGRGVHVYGVGDAGPHGCRDDAKGLEFYTEGRFVALTGNMLGEGTASASSPYLAAFVERFMPLNAAAQAARDGAWTEAPRPEWDGYTDDAQLIDAACRSNSAAAAFGGKASFADLWHANAEALARSYPADASGSGQWNGSAADAALAQHLAFWTGGDCDRIERLMRASALSRGKWDDHATYMVNTVIKAAAMQGDVHQLARLAMPAPTQVAPAGELLAPVAPPPPPTYDPTAAPSFDLGGLPRIVHAGEVVQFFDRHAYILADNSIYTPGRGRLDQGRFRALYGGWAFALDPFNGKPTHDAWKAALESQIFTMPRVTGRCFRPELPEGEIVGDEGEQYINTYRPIETLRKPGDIGPFLRFLEKILPDARDRLILLSYMAAVVQNPGFKAQWWPVLQGTEGNGKTLLISAMRHAIGNRYTHLPNVSAMAKDSKFNGWVEGKLFLGLEEVYVPHRRDFLEEFKTTVTNEKLPIEAKGIDQYMGDNRANGMMATNHRDGVPVGTDQRRYCVFYTAQQCAADLVRDGMSGHYFPDLYAWAKGEGGYADQGEAHGFAVINDFLRTYTPAPEFDPTGDCQRAPRTSSSASAIEESLGAVEQAFRETVAEGRQGMRNGWVSSHMLDRWLKDSRLDGRMPIRQRAKMLHSLGYIEHPGLDGGRATEVVLPDGVKPRLFVQVGHPDLALIGVAACRAYTSAQSENFTPFGQVG